MRISAFFLAFLLMVSACKDEYKPRKPNLLIVFPDQWRGSALGFLGKEPVITPRLDKFAEESVVLPQAASNYPVCSPYRAMLLTGKYPLKNHVTNNCMSRSAVFGNELQQSDTTWSDILHAEGYNLGYIGKWHLEAPKEPYINCLNNKGKVKWNEWTPPERRHGFDFWYAYNTYDDHTRPLYWDTHAGRNEFHYVDQWGPEHEADLAIEFLKNKGGKYRKHNKPFALVVSMNPPHTPYEKVPQKYVDMYHDMDTTLLYGRPDIPPAGTKWGDYYRKNIKNYYAMITGVDEQFGRILDALTEEGLDENTIVLFTSDHGNCLGIHELVTKNNPYEESMRIPFLLRWKGQLEPRIEEDFYISVPDIQPTLMQLMGFGEKIPPGVQGKSYARYFLTGEGEIPDSQLYFKMYDGSAYNGKRGIRTPEYKLVLEKQDGAFIDTLLFDLTEDPYEMNNMALLNPDIVNMLVQKEIKPKLKKIGDPFFNE